jgi:hypothetical protein
MTGLLASWLVFGGVCYGLVPTRELAIPAARLTIARPDGPCLTESPPDHRLVLALYAQRFGYLASAGARLLYGPTRPPVDGVRRLLCAVDGPTGRVAGCSEVGQPFTVDPALVAVAVAVCPEPLPERAVANRNPLADYVTLRTDRGQIALATPLWVLCWRNCWQTNNEICRAWWRGGNGAVVEVFGRRERP